VPDSQRPKAARNDERIERRRRERDPHASENWEQIVLQRMARRVTSLSNTIPPAAESRAAGSWEDAALRALQQRIRELESNNQTVLDSTTPPPAKL
jgi:uncharacterized coiled-coil protein SlyX